MFFSESTFLIDAKNNVPSIQLKKGRKSWLHSFALLFDWTPDLVMKPVDLQFEFLKANQSRLFLHSIVYPEKTPRGSCPNLTCLVSHKTVLFTSPPHDGHLFISGSWMTGRCQRSTHIWLRRVCAHDGAIVLQYHFEKNWSDA